MNIVRQLVLLALALLPVACTGIDSKHEAAPELAALRTMGYRIAVIPFAVSAPADGFLTDSLGSVGELISLEASRAVPMRERLGNVLHDDVVAWLQQTEFDVIDPWHVRTQLAAEPFDWQPAKLPCATPSAAARIRGLTKTQTRAGAVAMNVWR